MMMTIKLKNRSFSLVAMIKIMSFALFLCINLNSADPYMNDISSASIEDEIEVLSEMPFKVDDLFKTLQERKKPLEEFSTLKKPPADETIKLCTNKTSLVEKTINLCASELCNGKIDSAITDFEWLQSNSDDMDLLLRQIIEKSYKKYGGINELSSIIEFIDRVPNDMKISGYFKLFQEMKLNDTLDDPSFLFLYDKVKNIGNQADKDFSNFKQHLKTLKNNLLESLAVSIRNNTFKTIEVFFRKSYKNKIIFLKRLETIIHKTYSNYDTFDNIVRFIKKINDVEASITAHSGLYRAMEDSRHLDTHNFLMLAYEIKLVMSQTSYQNVDKALSDQYTKLKSKLPRGINALLWQDYVYITSKRRVEYKLIRTNYNAQVCHLQYCEYSTRWIVTAIEHKDGRYFIFKDIFGTYLSFHDGRNFMWRIYPIENGAAYVLKEKDSGRYLNDSNDHTVHFYREYTGSIYQHWIIR